MTLFPNIRLPSAVKKPDPVAARGTKRDNFKIVAAFAAMLKEENGKLGRENAALKRELAGVSEQRDMLETQKQEHQDEFPNGCVDANTVPAGNTYCPGTGRTDHADHSVLCHTTDGSTPFIPPDDEVINGN